MTFARLILEIRRRAAGLPQQLPKQIAIEQAARKVLQVAAPGEELDTTRQLADFVGARTTLVFVATRLATPEIFNRVALRRSSCMHYRPDVHSNAMRPGCRRTLRKPVAWYRRAAAQSDRAAIRSPFYAVH
jgi:hypothetical protein